MNKKTRSRTLTEIDFENVMTLCEKEIPNQKVADILSMSYDSVVRIHRCLGYMKTENWPKLAQFMNTYSCDNLIAWAAQKCGLTAESVKAKCGTGKKPEETPEEEPKVETPDNTALAVAKLMEAMQNLAASMTELAKQVSTIQLAVQGFRQEARDQTQKLVETINVNGDIITKEHGQIKDVLGAIKMNTKPLTKKGYYNNGD